ncbi:MAG: D-alanine--D-alanine ligase [Firmicutes bacterium]|nr:D-alanine--D-alanine ligase [Bacillota bacterium]
MTRRIRVAVLFGGRSGEHEVSLQSAASILRALDRERFEPVPIGITKEGRWLLPADAARALEEGLASMEGRYLAFRPEPGARGGLIAVDGPDGGAAGGPGLVDVDVVFPVLHGTYGEDGTVQGLLELAGIPYVGSGVLASALAMDKAMQKDLFRQKGIPVPDYTLVRARELETDFEGVVRRLEEGFAYPMFVKPANLGSSVGITKAHDRAELAAGLRLAAQYDRRLVVEEAIDGREIECSVLGNEEPVASLPGEVVPGHEFYDYEAKYIDDSSRLIIPAELDAATTARIQELAVQSFLALDASGLARVDFFLERRTGRVLVNEVNTMPGFTRISMYPKLWEASGLPYTELLTQLIELAFERHRARAALRTDYRPNSGGC